MKQLTVEQFLTDVSDHGMTVKRDDGLYRHLSFRDDGPNSWLHWFEIVTWPNALIIRGDMGSWSFSRIKDMFGFFRATKELAINAHYWEEKCESVDVRAGPCKVFDADIYRERILETLENYGLDEAEMAEVRAALEQELRRADDGQRLLYDAACDFKHGDFTFSDVWEISSRVYSYQFLWCLYAIVWGIQRYDAAKVAVEVAHVDGD